MENPDPTKFISIEDHVQALRLQQADFDETLASIRGEKEAAEAKAAQIDVIEAAIADEKLDDEATKAAIEEAIAITKLSEEDKEQAEIRRQIAELQSKLKS